MNRCHDFNLDFWISINIVMLFSNILFLKYVWTVDGSWDTTELPRGGKADDGGWGGSGLWRTCCLIALIHEPIWSHKPSLFQDWMCCSCSHKGHAVLCCSVLCCTYASSSSHCAVNFDPPAHKSSVTLLYSLHVLIIHWVTQRCPIVFSVLVRYCGSRRQFVLSEV